MSINVTVNGKPISLTKTRRRMVACEQDSDFNQRRKIRLQQVRQQSKEIAADVRNRVKQERSKQLLSIEHQTEKDLKKFQERKLSTLQKQYDECNRETGAAHKNATMEKDPSVVLNEISKKNDKSALARLKIAVENKAREEQQRQNKLELLEKQRKYSKEIEKTRANLVVAISKQRSPSKSKKRRKKNEVNLNDTSDIENISSPTFRRRSNSPVKPRSRSPLKPRSPPITCKKKHEVKPQQEKSHKPEFPKAKKYIFDEEVHEVCNKHFKPQEEKSFDMKFTQTEDVEKHVNNDVKFPSDELTKNDIECRQKESTCPVCFDIKSTQTEHPEKHIKIVENTQKEKSKVDKENKYFVSLEKSKSRQLFERKSEELYPKRVISSAKDDLNCDDDTYPCFSPLPHDKAILCPTSPPTKCTSHFSSSSSLTKELSKDEIKKLIEDHRPLSGCRSMDYYKSTKISDRIRQRSDQLIHDIDLGSVNAVPELKRRSTSASDAKRLQIKSIPIVDIPSTKEQTKDTSKLPYVPQTSLKSKIEISNVSQCQAQTSKVKYYDQSKHVSKTYVPPASVQKMDKECVEVDTSIESTENAKWLRNMRSQEQRAKIRGHKALKRAQVHNDYRQLLEELPVLQRQERLAAMRNHNPEFHMTDERLHELERRRQHRIENLFEKYYHKTKTLETPVITIRPVQKPAPDDHMKLPFTALDVSEDSPSLNIGQWRTETTKSRQFESQHSNRKTTDTSEEPSHSQPVDEECRQKCLAELLRRLNKQRELLLQEVQNLPPTSNLQKILHEDTLLHHVTDDSSNSTAMAKPKPRFVSASTSPMSSSEPKKKRLVAATSSDSSEEKHKKRQKPKEKKQKVVKNDEGTQTSPNISKKTKTTPVKEKPAPHKEVSHDIKNDQDDDKLCEIIIKMCDDSKVKICTQPIGISSVDEKMLPPPRKQINCDISSSTSYLSPPVICPEPKQKPIEQQVNEKSRSECYKDTLFGKPKQTNVDCLPRREEKTDHIKRHTICKQKNVKPHTPTKIINPQLLNYIKKLLSMSRKSIDDLTISSISDVSSPSPNVVESQHNNPFIQLQNVMNYYNLSFADIQNELSKSTASSTTAAEMDKLDENSSPTSDDVDYSDILNKYQEVTRTCVEKISTLTLMIDKIRAEKENILSPVSMDLNENTLTSYLELPPQQVNTSSTSGLSNKSCSLTQEEIDKYFLEIGPSKKHDEDQVDKDQGDVKEQFVPMLKGIPKYINNNNNEMNFQLKARPPASLAQNVQRYNLNIDMTPHELSTIIEMDTVTTSRNISDRRPKSPEEQVPIRDSDDTQTHQSTSQSGFVTITPEQEVSSRKGKRPSPRSKNTKTSSMNLHVSPSENTSSSSPENFENILRTMGLGWAVSTLKKTQEALALSSSSSSDSTLRKHVSQTNTSASDISLKDVLNREFLKKLSSPSSSESPNFQELQEISDIVGGTQNKDRSTQRTSTPVHQSKSTDSKENLFASVSDISSVRQHSDEMFLSIPDISLDTNRSLK